jgi:hypothetical protein
LLVKPIRYWFGYIVILVHISTFFRKRKIVKPKDETNNKLTYTIETIDHNTKSKKAYNNNTLEISTSVSFDIKKNIIAKSIEIQNLESRREVYNFPETIRESVNEEQTFRNPFESNRDNIELISSIPSDTEYKKLKYSSIGSPIKPSNNLEINKKKISEKLTNNIKCKQYIM